MFISYYYNSTTNCDWLPKKLVAPAFDSFTPFYYIYWY